jgi:hypothetical protein
MTDPDPLTDAFLDRIVDGELSPAELRGALDRLENEPDGWKRCALAFLEAQCWRESLRAERSQAPAFREGVAHSVLHTPPRSGRPSVGWRRVAMAAGIAAISFALGWRIHPDRTSPPGPGTSSAPAIVDRPRQTEAARTADLADLREGMTDATQDALPSPDPAPPVVTVGRLRVGPTDSAPAVPILAGPGIDEAWVRNQPPPITEHQQAILEQQGYQVDRRRRLITAWLADGRRVTVPVDQVQVRYTGIEPL